MRRLEIGQALTAVQTGDWTAPSIATWSAKKRSGKKRGKRKGKSRKANAQNSYKFWVSLKG